jgi:hypothetical protein
MAEPPDRIDYNKRGGLDDIVVTNVAMFRMERMDSGVFWIRCYCDGKPDVIFWLNSERKIVGSHSFED